MRNVLLLFGIRMISNPFSVVELDGDTQKKVEYYLNGVVYAGWPTDGARFRSERESE